MATDTERRAYTPEFKAEAVQLHRDGDSEEAIAAALDVSVPVLRTWILLDEVSHPGRPAPAVAVTPSTLPVAVPVAVPAGAAGACMVCGRGPARTATLRSVIGIFIGFRRRRVRGTFCRDCGMAMARRTLDRTLLTGWWGLFASFANLHAAAVDAAALKQFRRLSAPIGQPLLPPLPPGRSLFQRAGLYVGAVVIAASLFVGFAVVGTPADASAFDGKCIAFGAKELVATPTCDESHDARVVAVVSDKFLCPNTADATAASASSSKLLCIDLDQ